MNEDRAPRTVSDRRSIRSSPLKPANELDATMLFASALFSLHEVLYRVSQLLAGSTGNQNPPYTSVPASISETDFHDDFADERTEDMATDDANHPDAEFGGSEARKQLEKQLLWKLDARMSILVVIYILNYVLQVVSSCTFPPILTSYTIGSDRPE